MLVCVVGEYLFQRTRPLSKVVWSPAEVVRDIQAIFLCVIVGVLQNWFQQLLKTSYSRVCPKEKRWRGEEDIHLHVWDMNATAYGYIQYLHKHWSERTIWNHIKWCEEESGQAYECQSRSFQAYCFSLYGCAAWKFLFHRWILLKLGKLRDNSHSYCNHSSFGRPLTLSCIVQHQYVLLLLIHLLILSMY